ncbi:MAG: FAD/NAD(P)-binding oxidoreductase [Bacteroidota bacterium]|nr:FAD/NAD(P)-binding oxidoreductase [Bacteroidota bacterium]
MAQKTIVILGGGIGGIVTARELRKHLGTQHRIILVDKNAYHTFQPSYLWLVVGWRTHAAITKPYSAIEKYGIEIFQAAVQNIYPEHRKVETENGTLKYDYLVIALGADSDSQIIPGLDNTVNSFYTFEEAVELSKIIPVFSGGTIAIVVTSDNYKYPPAPYDAGFLLASFYAKRGITNVKIKIYTPEKQPLEFIGPENSHTLEMLLKTHGIELFTDHKLTTVESSTKTLTFANSIKTNYDLLITIPACSPLKLLTNSKLTTNSGWIEVDKYNMRTSDQNIYALGDNTRIEFDRGILLPKAGIFANNQAEIVAYNIAHEIMGNTQRKAFSGYGFFFIETGNSRAVNIHGNFFTKQSQSLTMNEPNVTFHWGKVVLERYWLWRWL